MKLNDRHGKSIRYAIGIDPGMNNGFAIYDRQLAQITHCTCLPLHVLFDTLKSWQKNGIEVFIENPNTWISFGSKKKSDARLQGAGAVKQTYRHIVEFLDDYEIAYTPTKLQGNLKKVSRDYFAKITGYTDKTNEHGRDAAMIVFKR
jgi:hypothetical protein